MEGGDAAQGRDEDVAAVDDLGREVGEVAGMDALDDATGVEAEHEEVTGVAVGDVDAGAGDDRRPVEAPTSSRPSAGGSC